MPLATAPPGPVRDQLELELGLARQPDERPARASLRRQIARLESELAALTVDDWISGHRQTPARRPPETRGLPTPQLLSLADLELIRDLLVQRVHASRHEVERRAESQAWAHRRLGAMLDDPGAHRYEVVRLAELDQPACGAYHVLPRLGLVGMLFGWWCVKLSSGCPLAMYHRSKSQRHEHLMYRRQARLELVVAIIVAIAIIAALAIFLLVYHDFPFRFGQPT
jgi:hypothetical protein